jgi:hypothetical protein
MFNIPTYIRHWKDICLAYFALIFLFCNIVIAYVSFYLIFSVSFLSKHLTRITVIIEAKKAIACINKKILILLASSLWWNPKYT